MPITYCEQCGGTGRWVRHKLRDQPILDCLSESYPPLPRWDDVEEVTCPMCYRGGKYRPYGETWTPLIELDRSVLEDMARYRPWMILNEKRGTARFIGGPTMQGDTEQILDLLRAASRIGHALEAANWLVAY